MKEITSVTNEIVKLYAGLNQKKDRDATQLFIVDGDHLVSEALKAGVLKTVFFVDELPNELRHFKDLIKVTPAILKKISNVETPKNIIGICHYQKLQIPTTATHLVALDGVQDPGNGGTILRSALAFGYDGMLISDDSLDLYNPKFIRATMGAFFALPIIRGSLTPTLKSLKERGYKVVVGDLIPQSVAIDEAKPVEPVVILVGNEGQGPSQANKALADLVVKIPISHRIDSLNVGVAAAILMQHFGNLK